MPSAKEYYICLKIAMTAAFENLRLRFLKILCLSLALMQFILAVYDLLFTYKPLAVLEFLVCACLAVGYFVVDKQERFVIGAGVAAVTFLITAVMYYQMFHGKKTMSIWLPVYVLGVAMITSPWGGIAASFYVLVVSILFSFKSGFIHQPQVSFYFVQLVMALILTSFLYFAFFGMWKKYEKLLRAKAEFDYLTGLYSRGKIFEIISLEIERANRYSSTFSVIMIDLDNFKKLNDEKGHIFGDKVLKEVAEAIRSSVRKVDYCGRYGGDEFLIVLPDTDAKGALVLANRIRKKIKSLGLGVSASFGISEYVEGMSSDDLVRAADEALYRAKSTGRDTVSVNS